MWPTIARARRRLTGDARRDPDDRDDASIPAPAPRLEDVVIILGAIEMFQLGEALEDELGASIERPDTPARFERALEMLLARREAPGTPTVLRRPAILTTPESWEIHIVGTDRTTSRALRAAARAGFFVS
jgi:hypothetical protein